MTRFPRPGILPQEMADIRFPQNQYEQDSKRRAIVALRENLSQSGRNLHSQEYPRRHRAIWGQLSKAQKMQRKLANGEWK